MDYSSTDRRLKNVVWFDESQAIQMVGSKFTVLCISTSDWWWQCKDVLEIIFGTLWAPLVADCVHAFTTTVCPLFYWLLPACYCTQMASKVTRS